MAGPVHGHEISLVGAWWGGGGECDGGPPSHPRGAAASRHPVQGRDPGAEDELVRLFGARIRTMMVVRTRDASTADDLTQDTMMAALVALRAGRLRATDRLAAFVYGVARNVLHDHQRGKRTRPEEVPVSPEMCAVPHQDLVEEKEREALVRRAIGTLPSAEREVLTLTLVEGLEPGAIARRLGLTPDVCRARKSRALKKIVEEVQRLSRSGADSHHVDDGGLRVTDR